MVDVEWMADALCRDTDDPRFVSADRADLEAAAEVCRGCAVRRPCLRYALITRSSGTWGGRILEGGRDMKPKR